VWPSEDRREQNEERVDVNAQPVLLIPALRRQPEEMAVKRVPDRPANTNKTA
jgi:hypothetical protein